jgi:hypothetical protein
MVIESKKVIDTVSYLIKPSKRHKNVRVEAGVGTGAVQIYVSVEPNEIFTAPQHWLGVRENM